MTDPTSEQGIEEILAGLRSEDANRRQATAAMIAAPQLQDDRIREALQKMEETDPSAYVRYAAAVALKLSPKPVEQLSPGNKSLEFAIGFVGWWVINVGAWLFVTQGTLHDVGPDAGICNGFLLLANLVALLILARTRRYIALGVLATYGLNFLVAISVGLSLNGVCWIPFLVRLN